MTAANGDKIYTRVRIGPEMVGDLIYYLYDIEGGTGRFEGITGEIEVYGTFSTTTWSLSGEGFFTYP